eukprot:Nitzschia sp. Nitz4//scaffold177_size45885//15963//16742//NITZ4_007205-RA/size45885-processed-gene-0.37-mRNA-1//1//CDS//3329539055//2087//frame0
MSSSSSSSSPSKPKVDEEKVASSPVQEKDVHKGKRSHPEEAPTENPTEPTTDTTGTTPESSPAGKRTKLEDAEPDSSSASSPLDLAVTLGYKAGDRVEVQWEIAPPNPKDPPTIQWWPATLMEFDGRTTDKVAIRSLHYDPFPEMGFPESSMEDVIFMGYDLLVSPDSQTQLNYRRLGGSEEEIVWYNDSDMDEQLNTILMQALTKNETAWKRLAPSQQSAIADKIFKKKAQLMQALRSENKIITSSSIKEILQRAFET